MRRPTPTGGPRARPAPEADCCAGPNTSECEVVGGGYFEGFAIEPMGFELDGPGMAMVIDSSRRL